MAPFNPVQVDIASSVMACTAVLWATGTLRRLAKQADAAQVNLADPLETRDVLAREADHRIRNSHHCYQLPRLAASTRR